MSEAANIFCFSVTAALFLSAVWGEMALGHHQRLPSPFSIDINRAKLSSRLLIIWSTPVCCAGTLGFGAWLMADLPRIESVTPLLDAWAVDTSVAMALLQGFTLWRLIRWAKS